MNGSVVSLTPRVSVLTCDDDIAAERLRPSVGIVYTESQTVLVDAGAGPGHAERIQAALRVLGAPPVAYVIYTHHHWDHVLGAPAFDAPIVAHERCGSLVAEMAGLYWTREALLQRMQAQPERAASLRAALRAMEGHSGLQLRLPSLTFRQRMRLPVDNLRVELEHVGGQHALDSIVVRVPEEGVLFLGDCYYPPPLHLRSSTDGPDLAMLELLGVPPYEWYVAGHQEPFTFASLRATLAALA